MSTEKCERLQEALSMQCSSDVMSFMVRKYGGEISKIIKMMVITFYSFYLLKIGLQAVLLELVWAEIYFSDVIKN
jgi:hypothetical protein